MRATTKTITFPFSFQAPNGSGQYIDANAITLCEPGWDHRAVHHRMSSWVAEAQKGLVKVFSGLTDKQIEDKVEEESDGQVKSKDEMDALLIMRMGLDIDQYEQFTKYVERTLRGQSALAYLGADPESARIAVSEEALMNLVGTGGMRELERLFGEFASFFIGTQQADQSAMTTGTGSSSPSGAKRKGSSRTAMH